MSILKLPLEILYSISTIDPMTWRDSVLSLPFVWRTFGDDAKKIRKKFIERFDTSLYIAYFLCGKLHREDGPALICKEHELGYHEFLEEFDKERPNKYKVRIRKYDECDCTNGIAFRFETGKYWYRYGKLHRDDDKPAASFEFAIISQKEWWVNGKLHREGDKPAIISKEEGNVAVKSWYKKGLLHREGDEPAIVSEDLLEWRKRGLLHRKTGPAMIGACLLNGKRVITRYWYLNNLLVAEESAGRTIICVQ